MYTSVVRKILDAGFSVFVGYDDETDYVGKDFNKIIEALEACDEVGLRVIGEDNRSIAWAIVLPCLADDETIVDCSASFERFMPLDTYNLNRT